MINIMQLKVKIKIFLNSFNYARTTDFTEICKLLTEILEEIDIK